MVKPYRTVYNWSSTKQEIDDIVNGLDEQYKQVGNSSQGDIPIKVSFFVWLMNKIFFPPYCLRSTMCMIKYGTVPNIQKFASRPILLPNLPSTLSSQATGFIVT